MNNPEAITHVLGDLYSLQFHCVFCSTPLTVELSQKEYDDYYTKGKLIQFALPNHSKDDREILVSQVCPACWKKM